MNRFAIYEGKVMFRLIGYNNGTFDIENGMMERLNPTPLLTHDESMAFIHKYSMDNAIINMSYTLIERKSEAIN